MIRSQVRCPQYDIVSRYSYRPGENLAQGHVLDCKVIQSHIACYERKRQRNYDSINEYNGK